MAPDLTSQKRNSLRHTALSSPLEQTPKFTPPAASSARNPSPVRKPLHDRSNSQTNQFSGPTIRIVQDPGSDIYSKYPVPSQPAHILPPPRHAPGYGFERPAPRVSRGSQVANTIAKFEASRTRVLQPPPPLQLAHKKKTRHSVSTTASDTDTLVASAYTPSSLRFSQGSTPSTSDFTDLDKTLLDVLEEEKVHPLKQSTIRVVPPSSSGGDSLESRARALSPKASAASLASTIDAASPNSNNNADGPIRIISPVPRGYKHKPPTESDDDWQPENPSPVDSPPALKSKTSQASFALSDISIEPTHHTIPSSQPSPTLHEAHTATITSGARITYPLVRAPLASSQRIEPDNTPSPTFRMQDPSLVHQWSSQLSTIPSMSERDSQSLARISRSYTRSQSQESYSGNGFRRPSYPRAQALTEDSAQSSADNVSSEGQIDNSALPLPLFSPLPRASGEGNDHGGEHLDTISPLPTSVPLRIKTSGYLRSQRSNSSLSSSDSQASSPLSDVSTFVQNAIPAWARVYYRRGERVSMGAPGSDSSESLRLPPLYNSRSRSPSDSNFPLSIYRPRNRPRNRDLQADTDDMQSENSPVYALGPQMQPLSGWSTPRLRNDRRGGATRYNPWKAPSFDSDLHTTLFSRQNRQILLFCVGFIFPLAWMIASCLPLPLNPNSVEAQDQTDVEQQSVRDFGPVDDKAFQKATWWRNLNRLMSAIGTLLIGVIIALAVLASRVS
ncbi:hypothetical protein ACEQ8H_007101 [Pleosporales sp. CAS-2024a]